MVVSAAVRTIYVAIFFTSFNYIEADGAKGIAREPVNDDDSDAYWCSTSYKNLQICVEYREIMMKFCKNFCQEGLTTVDDFVSTYNKTYANAAEAKKRMLIFQENHKAMKDHNKLYESGESTFMMGVNEYFDLTYEEVISTLTGAVEPSQESQERKIYDYDIPADDLYVPKDLGREPEYLDYRDMGALNPVRNQGGCGSCYAFSSVASIESNIFLKNGEKVALSEQSIVDCDSRGSRCHGGWPDYNIYHVKAVGIAHRDEYEYTGVPGTCKKDQNIFPIAGQKRVRKYNQTELLNALYHMGPITITMYVTPNFRLYKNGTLVDDLCVPNKLNHAMLLVGYGTEDGQDYWLLRNSWGESWGENGYIKMARNLINDCGISKNGYVPVIKDSPACEDSANNCADFASMCKTGALEPICQKTCGACSYPW